MAIFKTTDNNGGKQLQTISHEYEKIDFKAAVNDIKIISNKTLAELAAEENLLIFPIRLDDSADLLNHSKICSLSKSDKEEGYIFSTENVGRTSYPLERWIVTSFVFLFMAALIPS